MYTFFAFRPTWKGWYGEGGSWLETFWMVGEGRLEALTSLLMFLDILGKNNKYLLSIIYTHTNTLGSLGS